MKGMSDPIVVGLTVFLAVIAFLAIMQGGFESWAFAALIIIVVIFYGWGQAPGLPHIG